MSTRLEGVFIPVELDTSKAQRQLDELERQAKTESTSVERILQAPYKKLSRGVSGSPSGSSDSNDVQKGLASDFQRLMRLDRLRKFGAARIGQEAASRSVSGVVEGALAKAVGEGLPGALKAAGGIYAGVRTVALNAPLALEAGRAFVGLSAKDPNFIAVSQQLENLRNSVSYMESYIKSAVTGLGKTYDIATAMARVRGKVPNVQIGYGIYKEADMQEDMLSKKFEEFRAKEVAEAVGVSMSEMFKGGWNK